MTLDEFKNNAVDLSSRIFEGDDKSTIQTLINTLNTDANAETSPIIGHKNEQAIKDAITTLKNTVDAAPDLTTDYEDLCADIVELVEDV